MKKTLLLIVVVLLIAGSPVFAKTKTTSVSLVNAGYMQTNLNTTQRLITSGVAFRSITCKYDVGGYGGFDISLAVPTMLWALQISPFGFGYSFASSLSNVHADFRIPFGKRWAGEGRKMGFYLGGGPEIYTMIGSGVAMLVGGFGELGWQTNKTEGVGLHIGMKLGYLPFVASFTGGFYGFDFSPIFWPSFELGISWRRIKR